MSCLHEGEMFQRRCVYLRCFIINTSGYGFFMKGEENSTLVLLFKTEGYILSVSRALETCCRIEHVGNWVSGCLLIILITY